MPAPALSISSSVCAIFIAMLTLDILSSPRCVGYLDFLTALQQPSSGACSPALQQLRALFLRVDRRVLAPHRWLERHPRDSAPRAPCRPPAYSLLLQRFQTRPTARPITVEHANPSPKWVPSLAAQNTGLHNHTNPAKGEAADSPRSARPATDKLSRIDPRESTRMSTSII